jgi:hypothetical protein
VPVAADHRFPETTAAAAEDEDRPAPGHESCSASADGLATVEDLGIDEPEQVHAGSGGLRLEIR